jgi:hypothetical protein
MTTLVNDEPGAVSERVKIGWSGLHVWRSSIAKMWPITVAGPSR